ncbi:hypothetical protein ABW21_db0209843 [Orbilia brochopaga]|nr:hypothetical protein ABW21_db0209843 [Drechslerella brochopaga]
MSCSSIDIASCIECAQCAAAAGCGEITDCADCANCADCAINQARLSEIDNCADINNCNIADCDSLEVNPFQAKAAVPAPTLTADAPHASTTENPMLHIVSHIINDTLSANAALTASPQPSRHFIVKRQDTSTTTQTHTLVSVSTSSFMSTSTTSPSTTTTSTSIYTTTGTATSGTTVTATGAPTVTVSASAAGHFGKGADVAAGMASWITLLYLVVTVWMLR